MKCKQIKTDGTQCEAEATKDSEFCFWHDPATEQERKEASSNGGRVGYDKGLIQAKTIDITIDKKAVIYLLADTINRARRIRPDGSIDVKVANCIGQLAGKMIEAQRELVVADRLDRLEEALKEKAII